jgi:hypothetical protein
VSERYDDFDRALLRAGKRAVAPSRLRARALGAAAAAGVTTATTTAKAATATKMTTLAKAAKLLSLKWTLVAAVTTASVGTAVYVHESEKRETRAPAVEAAVVATASPTTRAITKQAPPPATEEAEPEPAPAPPPVVTVASPRRAIVPVAPPSASTLTTTVDPLREEIALLDRARSALASGDSANALRLVDEHAARFASHGAFGVESDVIRIDALAAAGRRDEATACARDFLARHPASAQARRIAKMVDTNP